MRPFPFLRVPFLHLLRRAAAAGLCATLMGHAAWAQDVVVQNAWVRATVTGQKATGAFMSLTSATGSRLKSVTTPVAGVAEVHEMRVEDNIMKMQALKGGLELPAGKTVELKPGSYHLMLMDLKMPLPKDSSIPLTLVFVNARGVESKSELTLPVSVMAPTH
jgi:copper(I)-binding protein